MTLLDRPETNTVDALEQRVRDMATVRQMAARVVAARDGRSPAQLTDREWHALCASARGTSDEKVAVARVIRQADRSTRAPAEDRARELIVAAPPAESGAIPTIDPVSHEVGHGDLETIDPLGAMIPAGFGTAPVFEPLADELKVVPDPTPASVDRSPDGAGPRRIHRRSRRTRPRILGIQSVDDGRRERWLTIASWIRNVGLIILLFVAWQLWGTSITEHQSQEALKKQYQAKVVHAVVKQPAAFTLTPATEKIADPPDGQVMAELQIPAIGLSQFVVSGTNEGDLAKGPGHYIGTAMPGQAGNVAIAGHRTTHGAPFNRLAELTIGDPIYLTTVSGQRLTYIVSAVPVPVSPTDVTVLNNFGDNRLTLTTCNPEYSARQRLIVVAAYLPPGQTHPQPILKTAGTPYRLTAEVTSGWNLAQVPLVLLIGGLLVALGLFFKPLSRTYGREVRWLILVPIWLALLLALFEVLSNVLPASV